MIQQLEQQWETHKSIDFYYIINNTVVSKAQIQIMDNHINLNSVYTIEQHRGKTYCTQIIKEVLTYYDPEKPLYLLVNRLNASAIRIYKSLGFEHHSLDSDEMFEWLIYEKQK